MQTSNESAISRAIITECLEAFLDDGSRGIQSVQTAYRERGDLYRHMSRETAPASYAYFWCYFTEIYEGKYLLEFVIHHIHRQSILSPDGWSLYIEKYAVVITGFEADIYRNENSMTI